MDEFDCHDNRLSKAGENSSSTDIKTDIKPLLTPYQAKIEASRCLYCAAAPCITACPTGINIPSFIQRIATDNTDGAAQTILNANILGGSCARTCPTEVLCEGACVRNREPERQPIQIGRLQRFAVDNHKTREHPFCRQPTTGQHVAIVGTGPAGLACAHALAREGHDITLFEAREKPGGLNEYGIAPYKLVNDYARQEVEFVLGIGGIATRYGVRLGKDLHLDDLRKQFSAVFLAPGLGGCNRLGLDNENLKGVTDAISAIAELRQSDNPELLNTGCQVVVIGGGSTAIDIACQVKRLGADEVTMVFRRGHRQMSATDHELAFARENGIGIMTWARPVELEGSLKGSLKGNKGHINSVRFERTRLNSQGQLTGKGLFFTLQADQLYKAIGQHFLTDCFTGSEPPAMTRGRIQTDPQLRTSLPDVWAGGDCIPTGADLVVHAVQHGKLAARAMHHFLMEQTVRLQSFNRLLIIKGGKPSWLT